MVISISIIVRGLISFQNKVSNNKAHKLTLQVKTAVLLVQ